MSTQKKAPGKAFRKGISLPELMRMFPDDTTAEQWFIDIRWPNGPVCPHCGTEGAQHPTTHPTMPYRCQVRKCGKFFSVKTGTLMHGSKLGYQTWAIAIYLYTTSLKSVSSMKLHRDLVITQKAAWHLAQRLREAHKSEDFDLFDGPVEIDETWVGGLRKNMSLSKRRELHEQGHGYSGFVNKTIVAGIKDRDTNQVRARRVTTADKPTMHRFIAGNVEDRAMVYTDDAAVYQTLPHTHHHSVNHSAHEYVRGDVHINGMESFWAMLKRAYKGTFHKLSPKHIDRYVTEFATKHNIRDLDTIDQMRIIVYGMMQKRLSYKTLGF